jgi:FtsP/CotA-like multicopper oxidase with cupredoxin domain
LQYLRRASLRERRALQEEVAVTPRIRPDSLPRRVRPPADLDAGEYVFYCPIGNHRAMGMELTVEVT